jgi:RNA-splicing ligase RtcB
MLIPVVVPMKLRMSRRLELLKLILSGVRSAGLDEVPWVYKDIEQVMSAQASLVRPLARFMPRLVKMSPPGHRPED